MNRRFGFEWIGLLVCLVLFALVSISLQFRASELERKVAALEARVTSAETELAKQSRTNEAQKFLNEVEHDQRWRGVLDETRERRSLEAR